MNNKKVIAIIPARGGSKGVLNKNLRLLKGKPLVQYSIDYAKKSKFIHKVVVSTDSDEIAAVALKKGVEVVKRPDEISGDKALVIDAVRQVVEQYEEKGFFPDIIVLLECTSPIKSVKEIDKAIKILANGEADSVATFKELAISPNRIWRIEDDVVTPYINDSNPFLPRQIQPKGYQLTGQVYALTTQKLKENPESISILLGTVFPIITETEVVDIDSEIDLLIAEAVLEKLTNDKNLSNL